VAPLDRRTTQDVEFSIIQSKNRNHFCVATIHAVAYRCVMFFNCDEKLANTPNINCASEFWFFRNAILFSD